MKKVKAHIDCLEPVPEMRAGPKKKFWASKKLESKWQNGGPIIL
jgi:hypothetical protein